MLRSGKQTYYQILRLDRRYFQVMRSKAPALLPMFRSQHQAELLLVLLLHPDDEFGLTELAKTIGVPLSTLQTEVNRLETAGLVTSHHLGRTRLIRCNPAHPATPSLSKLLEVTLGPKVVVGECFDIPSAELVIIFGSWAARYAGRGGPPPRDVDVLVVGDVDRSILYAAADKAQSRLGMDVNPVLRSLDQWTDRSDALVQQIKAGPYLTVVDRAAED